MERETRPELLTFHRQEFVTDEMLRVAWDGVRDRLERQVIRDAWDAGYAVSYVTFSRHAGPHGLASSIITASAVGQRRKPTFPGLPPLSPNPIAPMESR